jgi:flagellar basal body-associated protein FliL
MSVFCDQCGRENDDNTSFCIYCGNVIEPADDLPDDPEPESPESSEEAEKKKKTRAEKKAEVKLAKKIAKGAASQAAPAKKNKSKKKLVAIIIAVVVLALAGGAVAGYFFFFKKSDADVIQDVDMSKAYKYDYDGDLGWYIETDGDYLDAESSGIDVTYSKDVDAYEDELELYCTIEGSTTNLENGDEITIKAHYNTEAAKKLKLNVKETEKKVTVEGLTDRFKVGEEIPSQIVYQASSAASDEFHDYISEEWESYSDIDGPKSVVMCIYTGKDSGKTDDLSFLYKVEGYKTEKDWDDDKKTTLYYVISVVNVKRDFMKSGIKTAKPYLCGINEKGRFGSDSEAISVFESEVDGYKYTKINRENW